MRDRQRETDGHRHTHSQTEKEEYQGGHIEDPTERLANVWLSSLSLCVSCHRPVCLCVSHSDVLMCSVVQHLRCGKASEHTPMFNTGYLCAHLLICWFSSFALLVCAGAARVLRLHAVLHRRSTCDHHRFVPLCVSLSLCVSLFISVSVFPLSVSVLCLICCAGGFAASASLFGDVASAPFTSVLQILALITTPSVRVCKLAFDFRICFLCVRSCV